MQINATINKYRSSINYPSSVINCSILRTSSKGPEMGLLGKQEFLDIFTNPQMAKESQRPTSSPPLSDFSIVPTPNPSPEQHNCDEALPPSISYNQVLPITTGERYAVFELFYIIIVYPTHYSESILSAASSALTCIPATPLTKLFQDTDTAIPFGIKTVTKPNP